VAVTPDGKHVYVTDLNRPGSILVIDTTNNTVAATVSIANTEGVAVNTDGKHAYVTSFSADPLVNGNVAVLDTATKIAMVPVGRFPAGVAVAPNGTRAYVANGNSNDISVINTATNTVVATVGVGHGPSALAVSPDGKRVYVTIAGPVFLGQGSVSVIDTATNTVVASVAVGIQPAGVAITPDGKRAYVLNFGFGNKTSPGTVSVIDTATNTVIAIVGMGIGLGPTSAAITPDGKRVYVTNQVSNSVSVINTATNTVLATVGVGKIPLGVAIIQPQPGVPFSAFTAKLEIDFGPKPNEDVFVFQSNFTLGSASNGIHPVTQKVILQVGTFTVTIPPGSFKGNGFGPFTFFGQIHGVALGVVIEPTGTKRYALEAAALDANLKGTKNTVPVTLIIGDDSGTTSVTADLD
jgi:YVTN family beta-propeller protein